MFPLNNICKIVCFVLVVSLANEHGCHTVGVIVCLWSCALLLLLWWSCSCFESGRFSECSTECSSRRSREMYSCNASKKTKKRRTYSSQVQVGCCCNTTRKHGETQRLLLDDVCCNSSCIFLSMKKKRLVKASGQFPPPPTVLNTRGGTYIWRINSEALNRAIPGVYDTLYIRGTPA